MIGAQHCQATPRTLFPPWWGYRAGTCAVPNPTKFFARSAGRGSLRHTPPPRWSVGVWTPCMAYGTRPPALPAIRQISGTICPFARRIRRPGQPNTGGPWPPGDRGPGGGTALDPPQPACPAGGHSHTVKGGGAPLGGARLLLPDPARTPRHWPIHANAQPATA